MILCVRCVIVIIWSIFVNEGRIFFFSLSLSFILIVNDYRYITLLERNMKVIIIKDATIRNDEIIMFEDVIYYCGK